jgi:hypothetical protein
MVSKKSIKKKKVKTVTEVPASVPKISMKTVRNVSLQTWPVPTGRNQTIKLTPGASVEVPASVITERLLNLHKRRLISIN